MNDGMRIIGRVRLTRVPAYVVEPLVGYDFDRAFYDGLADIVFDEHNLVVDIGMQAIAKFLGNNMGAPTVGGSTFADLSSITVGTMEIGDAASPAAPLAGDTTGVASLVYTPPITVSYPTSTSIKFSGVIPAPELVGTILTEEALKLVNGKLFAKCNFPTPYTKTGAHGVQIDHLIQFARS